MAAASYFLAIDIGNTHTVLGVYAGAKLISDWRISSATSRTEDETALLLLQFLQQEGIKAQRVESVGISSVVPNLTDAFVRVGKRYFHRDPVVIGSNLDLGIKIFYDDPSAVGADRLCNAVAGFTKYGGPLIIVDFGTATTYDLIDREGNYLGGVIAPGIETSAADLHRRAAKLPNVELRLPEHVAGTNTTESMRSGILFGAIDATEGMVQRLQRELLRLAGKKGQVIATGGFSHFVAKNTKVIEAVEPTLVLDGVRLICHRLGSRSRRQT